MDLRVLLIHGDRPRDFLYKTALAGAEPAMHISVAETTEEVQGTPLPELILLDLDHWRPPSLEILKWLRSQKPYARIPVIALTSAGATDRVSRAYELGANSCVMKHENGGLIEDVARGIGSYAKVLQLHRQTA